MAVKKKAIKVTSLDDIIERGGKTAEESFDKIEKNDELRFTLRISKDLIKKIDEKRKSRIGNISRNQWIIEAIASNF